MSSNNEGYTLRVPVRPLEASPVSGLDSAEPFHYKGLIIELEAKPPFLVLTASPFATEAEALAFLPRAIAGFRALAVRWNVAFRADFSPATVAYSADPIQAGENLSKGFGLPFKPVDGLTDGDRPSVFPVGKALRFLSMGDVTATVTTSAANALPTLFEGIQHPHVADVFEDEKFATAVDLYVGYFYESSVYARFLTLMMILEVLAPTQEKHPAVKELVVTWRTEIERRRKTTGERDVLQALESLDRELGFRQETSIRQRVRALVRREFADLPEGERLALEKSAVEAYDARGTLTHTGTLDPEKLGKVHEPARSLVRTILLKRMGLRP